MSAFARVPLDAAWAWWTDFGEAGERFPMSHGFGPMQRRILSREGRVWVMEERGPLGIGLQSRRRVSALDAEHAIVEDFLKPAGLKSRWQFAAEAGGTRVSRTLRVSRRYEKMGRWIAQRDLEHHVRELERRVG